MGAGFRLTIIYSSMLLGGSPRVRRFHVGKRHIRPALGSISPAWGLAPGGTSFARWMGPTERRRPLSSREPMLSTTLIMELVLIPIPFLPAMGCGHRKQ